MKNFSTVVTMLTTSNQFEADLREPLIKLGCNVPKINSTDLLRTPTYLYLTNSYGQNNDPSDLGDIGFTSHCAEVHIPEYNPELFLAISAMTKGDEWEIGEYLYQLDTTQDPGLIFKVTQLSGCNGSKGYAGHKYTEFYRKATVVELINHFSKETKAGGKVAQFPCTINTEEVNTILKAACGGWKKRIAKKWAESFLLNQEVEVDREFYDAMVAASDNEQLEVLEKVFGKIKPKLEDGTPCFVRNNVDYEWEVAIANGKGSFYYLNHDIKRDRETINYEIVVPFPKGLHLPK